VKTLNINAKLALIEGAVGSSEALLLASARKIVGRLERAGFAGYFVGGAVRDIHLGRALKEVDIATDALPADLKKLFKRTVLVGEAFGVVCVFDNELQFEVATFRQERGYTDGRHPDIIAPGTLEQDVARRDFTVNGLVLDPTSGDVLDYVGGLTDLDQQLLKAIGEPAARMQEDYLRALRAARFAAVLDFRLDPATQSAVRTAAPGLERISRERVRMELEKMCAGDGLVRGLNLLDLCGLARYVFPFFDKVEGEDLAAAGRMIAGVSDSADLPLLLAALNLAIQPGLALKPASRRQTDDLLAGQARDLRMSSAQRKELQRLVALVAGLANLKGRRLGRRAELYRLAQFPRALQLVRTLLDDAGKDRSFLDGVEDEKNSLQDFRLDPPALISGQDIAAAGLSPGPRFKALLQEASWLTSEGTLSTREEALAWLEKETSGGEAGNLDPA